MITGGEHAADGVGRPLERLRREKNFECFLEAALQKMLVAGKWNPTAALHLRPRRQMEPVNRVEEKERAHALVKIVARPAKPIEGSAFGEKLGKREVAAELIERSVPVR